MDLIIFLVVLGILVIVHEWGHFITAKLLKVKVEKFSMGFGPKIFSRKHDGTEFMVSIIPLGGYVKLAGDERAQCQGHPDEFFSHPVGHRTLIVLMGPMINFVFALVCFYFIFLTGFPMLAPKVGKIKEGFPAYTAGLIPGDQIVQIDQKKIISWDDMQEYITRSTAPQLDFTVLRAGEEIHFQIAPEQKILKNIFGQEERLRVIGVQPSENIAKEEIIFVRYNAFESLLKSWEHLARITSMTYKALYHVVSGAMPAKDALAGPIRIFDVIKNAANMGIVHLVYVMAVISASLAIFNLFPVPVLDGGHLLMFAVEKVRGRPLPAKVEDGLMRVGFSLLMCLMVFVIYSDLTQIGLIDRARDLWQQFQSK